MFNSLKWDNFYKFLISVGIFLIITPLMGIYYISSNLSNKLISQVAFKELSNFSQNLLYNEKILRDIIEISSVFLIILGFVLIVWGGKYWYGLQKKEDKVFDAERSKKLENFEKAVSFANERALAQEEQSDEGIEVENNQTVKHGNVIVKEELTLENEVLSLEKMRKISKEYHRISSEQRTVFLSAVEEYYFEALENRFSQNYKLETNFIQDSFFDAVAISKNTSTDILFEIKVFTENSRIVPIKIYSILKRFERIYLEYNKETRREYILNLVIVSPKNKMQRIKQSVLSVLKDKGEVSKYPFQIEYIFAEDVEEFAVLDKG